MNSQNIDNNWVHFISIGGVTMAPLAKTFKKQGFTVTGSDNDLYEPIAGFVKNAKLSIFRGFNFKNLINKSGQYPGLIICGSGVSLKNREYLFAKKQNLNIKHFPEVIEELIVAKSSIVVAGTYGKTSVAAMLVKIFESAKRHVSYMYGALPVDGSESVKFKDFNTNFSVIEGDEYIASRWDMRSKFFYFHPDYLVLNAIQWDHTDVFKTEADYIENFQKLVQEVPQHGIIFANTADENVRMVLKRAKCEIIEFTPDLLEQWGEKNHIKVKAIGNFNKINAFEACYISKNLNVPIEKARKAIGDFKGIKRRLEVKYDKKDTIIVDDFASSAPKVAGSVSSIKDSFPDHKIIVVFEPNIGNRTRTALATFQEVFTGADLVVLPEFTNIVKSDNYPVNHDIMVDYLVNNKINAIAAPTEADLERILQSEHRAHTKTVFAFLSSHSMESRIQNLISFLKKNG